MREIRFRAFFNGKMYQNAGITPWSVILYSDVESKMITPQAVAEIGKDCDGLPLMQYTGLKDKNGVDIYEGDIVKTKAYNAVGAVYWNSTFAYYCVGGTHNPGLGWDSVEIIGNIHKDPGLLKDEG